MPDPQRVKPARRPRSNIRGASVRTLLSLIVVIAILPLAGMLWLTSLGVRESVLANAHATAQSLANENASGAFAALDEARRLARQLAARDDVRALDPARCDPELTRLRTLNPHYTNLGSVDADGQVVCSLMLPTGAKRPAIGNPSWLQAMRRDKQGKVGKPQLGIYTRDWIVVIAEPILGADGRLLGAAQVVIKLAAFQISTPTHVPPGGLTAIVDRQGIVVARSENAENWIGRDVSRLPVGGAVVAGRWDRAIIMAPDGVERLYGFSPIRGTDWVATAGVPTEAIHRNIRQLETRNAIAGLCVLALGGLLIWLIHRRIAMPLESLRLAAEAVSHGDPMRRAPVEGTAETRATALAFNQMLDRIDAMDTALRAGEARYRQLFESSPDAIRVICDGRIVMLNPAAVAMFDFASAEAALGTDVFKTIAADSAPLIRECFHRAAHEGATIHNPDVTFVRRNGSTVHAEVMLLPFVFEGRPAVLSVLHDLTARKEAQARVERLSQAREALARIHAAITRATDWPNLCQEACRIVVEHGGQQICLIRVLDEASGTLRRIAHHGDRFGRLGSTPFTVTDNPHPAVKAYRDEVPVRVADIINVASHNERQREWMTMEGVTCALFVPIRAERGVIGTFSIFGDEPAHFDDEFETLATEIAATLGFAHDKLAAEAGLRESEGRFRALTAMSSDWYWETDALHRFTRVTLQEHAQNHFAPTESMIGRTRWDSGLLEYDPEAMARHRMALMRHEPFRDFETRRRDVNGTVRIARISGEPVFGPDGTFTGYRGVGRDITEASAAHEAQLAAERQYRTLFDAMPAAVRVVCEGRVVVANSGAIELFGCGSEAATLGRPVFDTIAPEYHAKAAERLRAVLERGETVHTDDLEIIRADRSRVWAELVMRPFDYRGKPAILSIVRDNTARQAARARIVRLAELKDALSGTIEAMLRAPDWVELCRQVCDIASERGRLFGAQIRQFNAETTTLDVIALSSGLSASFGPPAIAVTAPDHPSAFVYRTGKPLVTHDYMDPASPHVTRAARQYIAHQGVRSGAVLPVKSGATTVAVLVVMSRETGYFNEELCKVLEELADDLGFAYGKMRAEKALGEAEERYRKLVDASANGIVILDGTRIEFANPAFARTLAVRSAQDTVGRDVMEFVAPEQRAATRNNIERLERGDVEALRPGRMSLVTQEGKARTGLVSGMAIQLGGRRLIQVELRDITIEQQALAEVQALARTLEQRVEQRTAELSEANRDLESFAYSVAHDLRAPLRAMSGYAQLLQMDIDGGEIANAGAHVERIVKGARRMNVLIDGLLRVARVSREALRPEPVDFNRLVEEVLTDAEARARARVEVGALPTLRADAAMMRQVWANLISNALKYSARVDQPVVSIGCERSGDAFVFRIRDNGAGFNPAEAGRLFGVFERLHGIQEFEGTGIGLAIVWRVVERHGGQVSADAVPGQGATFTVRLPAALMVTEVPEDSARDVATGQA